jgi:hypothetical protein
MKRSVVRNGFVLIGTLVILPSMGCFQPEPPRPEQLSRGLILLLPGVECTTHSMAGLHQGLRDAGYDGAIDLDIWGSRPFGTFRNLRAYELNRQRATRMAGKLAAHQQEHPRATVSIIGYSGGGAMAVFVAEALPEGMLLDRVVLLGGAISPTYDLAPVLQRCRRGVVNFYSQRDWFMGGWGTETFGTMDRVKTQAAGRRGFRTPSGELLNVPGLEQIAWDRNWRPLGHGGGHAGWLDRRWVRQVLAPYFGDDPDGSDIACTCQNQRGFLTFAAFVPGLRHECSLE